MERDNAVTALDDESTELMGARINALWQGFDPTEGADSFARLVTLLDLPSFDDGIRDRSLNVERFLELRSTDECLNFRAFLHSAGTLSDAELRARATSLRARLGNIVQSAPGRILRFLATAAIGVRAREASIGVAVGAGDSFLLEKLFPRSGIVTFVGKQYPSLFKE